MNRKEKMKKVFAIIICIIIMLAATACSNDAPNADNATVTAAPAETDAAAVDETDEESAPSVEVALLDNFIYEEDGETRTFLAIALKAPEKSSWSLRTKDGELIDTWINSYPNKSRIVESGERHCILLFNELIGEYAPSELALSVTYTAASEDEATELFGGWETPIATEARSEYGVHDFGGFIGFASQASVFGDETSVVLELVMTNIPFSGNNETTAYSNAAEQFSFFAKDGTPLAEALGYSQFEISNRGLWIDLKFTVQDGEPDGKIGAKQLKEILGYMEYTRDDGAVIRINIQP